MNACMSSRGAAAVVALSLTLAGCEPTEVVWVPFTLEGLADVWVVADEADCVGAPIEPPAALVSTIAEVTVAEVAVEPQCGLVGTDHLVTVTLVEPDHQDVAGRGSLRVQPGGDPDREIVFELERDSAAPIFGLTLESHGEVGEERTDTFILQLFQDERLQEPTATDG